MKCKQYKSYLLLKHSTAGVVLPLLVTNIVCWDVHLLGCETMCAAAFLIIIVHLHLSVH